MVKGVIASMSQKKRNTKISTEAELVGANDMSIIILWNKLFLIPQVYKAKQNILYPEYVPTANYTQ